MRIGPISRWVPTSVIHWTTAGGGIDALCDGPSVVLAAASPFYKTEPVDYLDQDWFVNAAIKVFTDLDPMALLSRIQEVQGRMGRKAGGIRFGPRILDLDIIFYRDLVLKNERLVIPHPRMHKRRFVLQPICDIDPTIVHPEIGLDVQTIFKSTGYRWSGDHTVLIRLLIFIILGVVVVRAVKSWTGDGASAQRDHRRRPSGPGGR